METPTKISSLFVGCITKSQQKWLDKFLETRNDKVIQVAFTKGGYISVDLHSSSKEFPFKREIRGVRGGFIASLQGRKYDFENNQIIDGIIHHYMTGLNKFNIE